MALRARLSACVSSVIRVATPAVARSACVRAQPAVCAAPIDLTARWLNTSTQEAVDGEPVDWTTLIPDNLQLHNPQDALPEAKPRYATDDVKTLPVLSFTQPGETVGEVTLDNRVFGVEIRSDIVHRVVQWQLANRRTKQYRTKTISEVSGGGRKPWAQKHTGRARTGSIRGSQWRGGAKPHGPKIRSWGQKLNKKVRALGLRMALAAAYHDRRLAVVDGVELESAKTGDLASLLRQHGWDDTRVLLIDGPEFDDGFLLAARNVKRLHPLPVEGANVFSLLKMDKVLVTPWALEGLYDRLIPGYISEEAEEYLSTADEE